MSVIQDHHDVPPRTLRRDLETLRAVVVVLQAGGHLLVQGVRDLDR